MSNTDREDLTTLILGRTSTKAADAILDQYIVLKKDDPRVQFLLTTDEAVAQQEAFGDGHE